MFLRLLLTIFITFVCCSDGLALTAAESITRFQANEVKINTFVNDEGYYTATGGDHVETLPSLVIRKDAEISQRYNVEAKGAWLTATAYVVNDVVTDTGVVYLCVVAHTSGTFATDLSAGKWIPYQMALPYGQYCDTETAVISTNNDAAMTHIIPTSDYGLKADLTLAAGKVYAPISGAVVSTYYSIRSATYRWVLTGSGTAEYRCELAAGTDPGFSQPTAVWINGAVAVEGTAGALNSGEWDYSGGYIIVRTGADSDPDSEALGYVEVHYTFDLSAGHLEDNGGQMFSAAAGEVVFHPGIEAKAEWLGFSTAASAAVNKSAIQAALNSGASRIRSRSGNYSCDGGITITTAVKWSVGAGIITQSDASDFLTISANGVGFEGEGPEKTFIYSKHNDANGIVLDGSAVRRKVSLKGFSLYQDAPASAVAKTVGNGLVTGGLADCEFENIEIRYANYGILVDDSGAGSNIVSAFKNVRSAFNTLDGIKIDQGNALDFTTCYALSNGQSGWNLSDVHGATLHSCSADSNGNHGFELSAGSDTNKGIALIGCGAESNTNDGIHVYDGQGTVIIPTWIWNNGGDGIQFARNIAGSAVIGGVINSNTGYGINVTTSYAPVHVHGPSLGSNVAGEYNDPNKMIRGAKLDGTAWPASVATTDTHTTFGWDAQIAHTDRNLANVNDMYVWRAFGDSTNAVAGFGVQVTDATNHYGDAVIAARNGAAVVVRMRVKGSGAIRDLVTTNGPVGACTLDNGGGTTTVVTNTAVTTASKILLFSTHANSAVAGIYVSAKTDGTSFTITHPASPGAGATMDYLVLN